MPANITGGPSRRHTLANQADIDQAEAVLQQRAPQGYRQPLPPPAPLPKKMLPESAEVIYAHPPITHLGGPQPIPVAPPASDVAPPLEGQFTVTYSEDAVRVVLWDAEGRGFVGDGSSLTEAVSLAAGKLEESLAVPRCPTCGQVMPTEDEEA